MSKNDHVRAMIREAARRGFQPRMVVFESWYAGLENLRLVRSLGWYWLTQFKANRLVNPQGCGNRPISEVLVPLRNS